MNWLVYFVSEFKLIELIRKLCFHSKFELKYFYFVRDPNFTLSEFIKSLKLELKTWRKVFWRLWGICHVSSCSLCEKPFQVGKNFDWIEKSLTSECTFSCSFTCWSFVHFTRGRQSSPTSSSRTPPFPWASTPAVASWRWGSSLCSRSEAATNVNIGLVITFQFQSANGCKVRDHKLKVRTQTDSELYRTLMTHRDLICVR